MKNLVIRAVTVGAIAVFFTVFPSISSAQQTDSQNAPQEQQSAAIKTDAASSSVIQGIVDEVKPALVRIHVVSATAQGGREAKSEEFGSGVIISPEGYVVTNHHVAGDAKWLSCTLSNREEVDAKLVGTDALADIAVIKLEPQADGKPYPVAQWGDSSLLRVGDTVLAMGSPFAFSQSVTAGIVSNTELIMPSGGDDFVLDGEDVGSIVRWIGHDAAIHPGNSGGPLVNLKGEIIGINEIEMGLSGAIPGDLAREVSAQLIERGHVTRAYLGLDLQPRLRGDSNASGVLVSGVDAGSPAAKAAVHPGDLLLQAGEVALDAKFSEQLPLVNQQLARLPLDRITTLTLLRAGRQITIPVMARPRDAVYVPSLEIKSLGITGMDITPPVALEMSYPDTNGVTVTSVLAGGPASEAKPAIEEGDVIISARGQTVKTFAALKSTLAGIGRKPDGTPILIEVRRDGDRVLCVANVNPENSEDASVEVAKAYLPVNTQVVTQELVRALVLPTGTQGVRITQIYPGSVAASSGLKVGDVITKLDGLEVEASQPEDTEVFATMIRQYKIGSWAKISFLRRETANGKTTWKTHVLGLKLPRAPKQERELAVYRDDNFGLTLRDITDADRLHAGAAKVAQGALITGVDEGSWAALAGLGTGDIIRSIDGVAVKNMADARLHLRALEKQRARHSIFFVSQGVHTRFVELQTDWSMPPAPAVKSAAKATPSPTL